LTLPLLAPILIGDQLIPLMENECPIRPHGALLDQWCHDSNLGNWRDVAIKAAQWGANMELAACCALIEPYVAAELRAVRRPKPPSLKEQAIAKLAQLESDEPGYEGTYDTIRHALEQLND
jgi:hypothetical protein